MTNARCKFRVDSVNRRGSKWETISLITEYDDALPEDTKFSESTPYGKLTFELTNPALIGKFNPGEAYYLDLTPAK